MSAYDHCVGLTLSKIEKAHETRIYVFIIIIAC